MSIFKETEILSSLSELEKEKLELFCQEKYLNKGEILFNENEEGTAMYILKEGSIEISKNIDNKKVSIGKICSEDILGEMALFDDKNKRIATATALTDSHLIVILSFSLKELTKKHPELLEKIKSIITSRIIMNKKYC